MGSVTLYRSFHPGETPSRWKDVMQGVCAKSIEKRFEDDLPIRQGAIQAWTAFTSSLFHTASKEIRIGKDGWYYTTEEFQYFPDGPREIEKKLTLIQDISTFLSRHHIALVVALLPAKARLYPEHLYLIDFPESKIPLYENTIAALRERGIHAPDLLPVYEQYRRHALAFPRTDTHWSPGMAAEVASTLAAYVRKIPEISLPTAEFKTSLLPEEEYIGDLPKRMVPTGVYGRWVGPFPEKLVRQKTEKIEKDQDDALFGDEAIPSVLVGTSYSAGENWNFDGALKTAFQADVLNMAIKGRGPLFPLDEFFKTTDFENAPPKLVIWEIPERSLEVAYDHEIEIPVTLKKLRAAGLEELP